MKKNIITTETEKTAKKWKKTFLLGVVFVITGWLMLTKSTSLGYILMFIGIFITIIAKIGSWWRNR